jgi:hypothetical protein
MLYPYSGQNSALQSSQRFTWPAALWIANAALFAASAALLRSTSMAHSAQMLQSRRRPPARPHRSQCLA